MLKLKKNLAEWNQPSQKLNNFENFYKFELCNAGITTSSNIRIQ